MRIAGISYEYESATTGFLTSSDATAGALARSVRSNATTEGASTRSNAAYAGSIAVSTLNATETAS
jgi:hypothetical protein|uniref:Uncharacterized protein n=1 Tax=Picea glauca TaxID=3330 RepID=A0A101M066_PICGL|nr:hypothetical protein ABT39_MTgene4629 [Picea glauca]QHR92487.1 hypothetical protein Q903MT_gene6533 [Picea sitchensis]